MTRPCYAHVTTVTKTVAIVAICIFDMHNTVPIYFMRFSLALNEERKTERKKIKNSKSQLKFYDLPLEYSLSISAMIKIKENREIK